MFYKIAELSIKSKKSAIRNSDVFVAQPSREKESLAGKLFILIEIESKSRRVEKVIQFLINEINTIYYNNEKILFREKIETIKIEHIFETSLTKVNKNFASFLVREKINIKLEKINITAGIIYNNDTHFANTGKNKILLIHKVKDNTVQKSKEKGENTIYKISDISKQAGNEPATNNNKLFSNVISGKIPQKGSFIISNEALLEYLSNKQLIDIASTLPPAGALEQIKQILAKTNFLVSFGAVLIKNTTQAKKEKKENSLSHSTQESITNLNRTEDTTESLLSPSGIINLQKWFKTSKKSKKSLKKASLPDLGLKDKILSKRRISLIQKISITLSKYFKYLIKFVPALLGLLISNKSKNTSSSITKLKNLDLKKKILLGIFLIFTLLFVFNISTKKIEEKKQEQQENYIELKDQIEKKQNKAEADLLYSNEEGARDLFNEIKELINKFPQDTDKQKKELENYKKILELNLEKIQKVTRLDNLNEIVNIKNLNQNANPENIIFVKNNGNIYSSDSVHKAIYSIDPDTKSVTLATNIEGQFDNLSSPAINSNNDLYFFDNHNILEYNIDGEAKLLEIKLSGKYTGKNSIDVYNNRLYILNSEEGTIHRHNRLAQGFGTAYSWANKQIDLSQSVDFSIDGYIYVLKSNGEVMRLLRGELTDWKIEKIDPPLTKPDKIIASLNQNFIYIMEKISKRIVVFDKDGQFKAQYTSNKLGDLKDFSLDEENKLIYVLAGSSVYQIEATHLSE